MLNELRLEHLRPNYFSITHCHRKLIPGEQLTPEPLRPKYPLKHVFPERKTLDRALLSELLSGNAWDGASISSDVSMPFYSQIIRVDHVPF